MGFNIGDLGMQAASQGLGTIFGLALGGYNDKRQLKQQGKLQAQQIQGNKEMTDYNYSKQLQMWKDTSYGAQKDQMKQAGINPGLMYGMGGGGGQSIGSAGPGVGGAQAPAGGGEIGMGIQQAMQLQLLKAQKENIEADTANKRADEGFTKGPKTAVTNTQIDDLKQGITNQKTINEIDKIRQTIAEWTETSSINKIMWEAETAAEKMKQEMNNTTISNETYKNAIKIISEEAIGAGLKNILTRATTENIKADTGKVPYEINQIRGAASAMYQQTLQGWDNLEKKDKDLRLREILQNHGIDPSREVMQKIEHLFNYIPQNIK